MSALGRTSRALFAGAALVTFALAFATAPSAVRSANGVMETRLPFAPPPPASPPPAWVAPRRDPFTGDTRVVRRAAPAIAAPPAVPPALPALAAMPAPPSTAIVPRVAAIVTGAKPYALVIEGAATRVVTVGDEISGKRVLEIALDGVRLASGTTLSVVPPLAAPNGAR